MTSRRSRIRVTRAVETPAKVSISQHSSNAAHRKRTSQTSALLRKTRRGVGATGPGLALQHRGAASVVAKQATESDEARQPRDGVAPCLLTLAARLTFLSGQVALLPGVQTPLLGQDERTQQELASRQRICLPQDRTGFL